MLQPESFGFNSEAAASNEFQTPGSFEDSQVQEEFVGVVEALSQSGVAVDVLPDDKHRKNPDAVFLNNWFSSHRDGSLVLYPMHNPSRRSEVRDDLVSYFQEMYDVTSVVDLRLLAEDKALEGTGSLVFDHANESVFLTPSERSDVALGLGLASDLNYHLIPLKAYSRTVLRNYGA